MNRLLHLWLLGKQVGLFNETAADGSLMWKHARFEVFCVLKNNNASAPLPENIVIKEVFPQNSCSGTTMTTDKHIILAIKRFVNCDYVFF